MNEFVGLPGPLMRNSLILIGLPLRTFSTVVSDCLLPFVVNSALAIRSPLKAAGPEVTLKVAFTLAPGATGSANVAEFVATAVHPFGAEMLNFKPAAGAAL